MFATMLPIIPVPICLDGSGVPTKRPCNKTLPLESQGTQGQPSKNKYLAEWYTLLPWGQRNNSLKEKYEGPKRTTRQASSIRPRTYSSWGSTSGLTAVFTLILERFLGKETTLALHYTPLSTMQHKASNLPILLGSSPGLFWIRRFFVVKTCNPLAPPAKSRPYLLDTASRLERSLGNSSGESKSLTFVSALNWKSCCEGSKQDQFREHGKSSHVCHHLTVDPIPVPPKPLFPRGHGPCDPVICKLPVCTVVLGIALINVYPMEHISKDSIMKPSFTNSTRGDLVLFWIPSLLP